MARPANVAAHRERGDAGTVRRLFNPGPPGTEPNPDRRGAGEVVPAIRELGPATTSGALIVSACHSMCDARARPRGSEWISHPRSRRGPVGAFRRGLVVLCAGFALTGAPCFVAGGQPVTGASA